MGSRKCQQLPWGVEGRMGLGTTGAHHLPGSRPQWIMDVLVCNGLGIYCGMKTLEWLSLKTYKWQGLWNIPTYKYGSLAALVRGGRDVSPTPACLIRSSSSPASIFQRLSRSCPR